MKKIAKFLKSHDVLKIDSFNGLTDEVKVYLLSEFKKSGMSTMQSFLFELNNFLYNSDTKKVNIQQHYVFNPILHSVNDKHLKGYP